MARTFDGTDDELSIDVDTALFKITGAVSMFCWFQYNATGVNAILFGKWSTTANDRSYRLEIVTTNALRFVIRQADGTERQANAGTIDTGGATWQAAGASFSPSSIHRCYLNGAGANASTAATDIRDTTSHLQIGENSNDTQDYAGTVAHAAIWNEALTDDEHLALAQGVSPLHIRRAALIGYWPLMGQSPEPDWSGNGNSMVVVAGTTVPTYDAPVQVPWVGKRAGGFWATAYGAAVTQVSLSAAMACTATLSRTLALFRSLSTATAVVATLDRFVSVSRTFSVVTAFVPTLTKFATFYVVLNATMSLIATTALAVQTATRVVFSAYGRTMSVIRGERYRG